MKLKEIIRKQDNGIRIIRDGSLLNYEDLEKMAIKNLIQCDLSFNNIPIKIGRMALKSQDELEKEIVFLKYCQGTYFSGNDLKFSDPALNILENAYTFLESMYAIVKGARILN
ncbi:hypothetical protein HYW74_03155 [Candidatus Pacearchaeota archaeon]|nr:hypothetical protein [Candidatus Pacearchaeota archaeon]